jgi:thymidylate kinase
MRVVEFVGLPGSGKTTIARSTAATLRARGVHVLEPVARVNELDAVRRSATKFAYCAGEGLRAPAATAALAKLVAESRQPNVALAARNLTNLVLQRALAIPARPADVVIHDQGVFQSLWSLNLQARNPPRLDAALYARVAGGAPHRLVVFLDADVARVLERLSMRSDVGRFARTTDASPDLTSMSVELLEQLFRFAESLSAHHGLAVARIDNRCSGLDAADGAVLRVVSEYLA